MEKWTTKDRKQITSCKFGSSHSEYFKQTKRIISFDKSDEIISTGSKVYVFM